MPSSFPCRSSQTQSALSQSSCTPLRVSRSSFSRYPHSACPCCRDSFDNLPCRALHLFPRSPWNQPDTLSQPAPPSIESSSSCKTPSKIHYGQIAGGHAHSPTANCQELTYPNTAVR